MELKLDQPGSEFEADGIYLDSASYGLPPRRALAKLADVTADWAAGRYMPTDCDAAVGAARRSFARLHQVDAADVAVGHQVSPFIGVVAGSLPSGARVLAAEGDFTSLLFPFVVSGCSVQTVPLVDIAEAVNGSTDVVAVSAVQSSDGSVAPLDALAEAAHAHGALTIIDATQASGWLPIDARRLSVLVAGGYKWLCHPRGTAFMTIQPELRERISPISAGWYSSEEPWASCYGMPLRTASDARRFDVSPAWLSWHAAAESLQLFEEIGIEEVHRHNLALANRLRAGLDLEPADSAIVSLDISEPVVARLAAAGIRASVRAGRSRFSHHLYNDEAHVDRTLEVLTS